MATRRMSLTAHGRAVAVRPGDGTAAMTAVLLARTASALLPHAGQVGARERLLAEAHAVLALHVADAIGWCTGCLDLARMAAAPCPRWRAALSVVQTHGVVVWDVPPVRARPG